MEEMEESELTLSDLVRDLRKARLKGNRKELLRALRRCAAACHLRYAVYEYFVYLVREDDLECVTDESGTLTSDEVDAICRDYTGKYSFSRQWVVPDYGERYDEEISRLTRKPARTK